MSFKRRTDLAAELRPAEGTGIRESSEDHGGFHVSAVEILTEEAERRAPSQAPAGGAPGARRPCSERPLPGVPSGHPGVRAASLPARSEPAPPKAEGPGEGTRASPKTWRFHGLLRLHALWL